MKTPYDDIFKDLRFTEKEVEIFMACLDIAKKSQEEGTDAVAEIVPKVRELAKDEI